MSIIYNSEMLFLSCLLFLVFCFPYSCLQFYFLLKFISLERDKIIVGFIALQQNIL